MVLYVPFLRTTFQMGRPTRAEFALMHQISIDFIDEWPGFPPIELFTVIASRAARKNKN
jgi:hypothetical protein